MIKRLALVLCLAFPGLSFADWAADRDGSLVYAPVTVLASAVDEAVPFFIVYGSDLDATFHAAMDTAGDTTGATIRASNADGTTQIACWPVGVNTSTDTFALFIKGDGMSASSDVDYRIYAGNSALSLPAVTDTYGRNAVFSGYAGVYLPGMSTDDFTGSGRNLTAVNSPGTAASSMEGITAATYNGTTQYHGYSGTQGVTNWPITLECVAYSATNTSTRAAFSISDVDLASNNLVDIRFAGATTGDPIKFTPFGATGSVGDADSTTGYTVNTWHYAAGTRDSNSTPGDSFAYIDGGSQGTNAANVQTPTDFDRLTVGGKVSSSINYFNGRVAIALLSGSVRSANYVSTMQDVWSGALYTAGASVEISSCTTGSTGWVLFQTASNQTGGTVAWTDVNNALVDDANVAITGSISPGDTSQYLHLTNPDYGTTVPTDATSYTVSLRIKHTRQSGTGREIYDETVQMIIGGTRTGTNHAKTADEWGAGTTTVDYTSDYAWTGSEFGTDLGLAIRVLSDGSNTATASVFVAWIKVDWVCPGSDPAALTRGFFDLD